MILNEDYFNELELDDEDVLSIEDINDNVDIYTDTKTLFNHLFSRYAYCLSISVTRNYNFINIYNIDEIWETVIP